MTGTPTTTSMDALGRRAKAAARILATVSTDAKNAALLAGADLLESRIDEILVANARDVAREEAGGMAPGLVDRLRLDASRVTGMANGLRQVAALPDPVGEISEGWTRPNGLRINRVRVPLGVVAIIYESRPNVTSDAFGLCLKSGNTAFLRGSSAAIESNTAIAAVLLRNHVQLSLALAGAALLFALVAFVAPRWLKGLAYLWGLLALGLAKIVNPLVMGIMYYGFITPYGLLLRMGRDPLRIHKRPQTGSYWRESTDPQDRAAMERQF